MNDDYLDDDYDEGEDSDNIESDEAHDYWFERIAIELQDEFIDKVQAEIEQAHRDKHPEAVKEVGAARALRAAGQDPAAAFFHAFRSVDGYMESVYPSSIAKVLTSTLDVFFKPDDQHHFRLFKSGAIHNVQNSIISHMFPEAETEAFKTALGKFYSSNQRVRNSTFHELGMPSESEVSLCIETADTVLAAAGELFAYRAREEAERQAKLAEADPIRAMVQKGPSDIPF